MRLLILALCGAVLATTPAFAQESQQAVKNQVVAVTSIVEHPALDEVRDGAREALEKAGYQNSNHFKFIYQSAQNRQSTAVQIARKFVGDKVNVIVAIGTPSAQAAVNATSEIPVVFAAVTDPIAAGLMKDPAHPDKNVTGVSDITPVAAHVKFIKELLPNAKKIGYLYNPSETNSVAALKILKEEAAKNGLEVVESTAIQTSQVRNATLALAGKVDAIYITTDNTVVSALETAIMVANENKIPFIAADPASASRGALAAAGVNYHDVGKLTGEIVIRLLKGEKIADIPMEIAPTNDLYINQKTAKLIGYHFPHSVVERATKIIE